jgi:Bifunctional DNA primase/polymerase, N-terminal/Primase C terminal 1 (PriCT-1)
VSGVFKGMQPLYAQHGIATFPVEIVDGRKVPMIRGYQRIGRPGSARLVDRYGDAAMLGYMTASNGKVPLDYDSTDERGLADALDRHGRSPLVVRTPSRKFHAYYKYNGERRLIRGLGSAPIDILGSGGFVVAPPSVIAGRGTYEIIEGSLDDLHNLPTLQNLPPTAYLNPPPTPRDVTASEVLAGQRNNRLYQDCMRAAARVASFDELLLEARAFNEGYSPPLDDGEVVTVARSAWSYEERGLNRFGQHGAWLPTQEIDAFFESSQDAMVLLIFLRAHQGPEAKFMVTNGLSERLGWDRKRLANARRRLIGQNYLKPIRAAGRGLRRCSSGRSGGGRNYDRNRDGQKGGEK